MTGFEPTRTKHLTALSQRLRRLNGAMGHLHSLLKPQLKSLESSFSKGEDSSALKQPTSSLDSNGISAEAIMNSLMGTARSAMRGMASEAFGSSKVGEGQQFADLATAISKAMRRNL